VSNVKPREIAVHLLVSSDDAAEFVDVNLDKALDNSALNALDRALIQELVFGVIRWRTTLDFLIDRKVTRKMPHRVLRWVLRLGLYQLFWLERIPDHAVVNETVNLTAQTGFPQLKGFVNALLRSYIRERDATGKLLAECKIRDPFIGYSHPEWLCDKWESTWGRDALIRLLEWNNQTPRVFARINRLVFSASDILNRWNQEGIEYRAVQKEWLPENTVYELLAYPRLTSLASFREGGFYIQDPSTLLAVMHLDPQPGERILDFCAAPGGKTTFIAERMNNLGCIIAHDSQAHRLARLIENLNRMKITCAKATSALKDHDNLPFDRILLDVPCSNTGVMRRRVELRWRINPDEILRLASVQRELLEKSAPFMKPGGTLVYSTCSLENDENRQVIDGFLRSHPEFQLTFERPLTPFADEVDGAYVARLDKAKV